MMSINIMDPVEAFKRTLCLYLRDRGEMLFSMVESSGQEVVRVALLALYRRHEPEETGYPRFEHVLDAIKECGEECIKKLEEIGVKGFEKIGDESYIVFNVDKLKTLQCREYSD